MAYIYKITNDINDKVYIGKTCLSLNDRFAQHCNDARRGRCEKRPLYSAIRKYGVDHFNISQIEECDASIAGDKEQQWIAYYDSYHKGYNATKGGDGKLLYDRDTIKRLYLQGNSLLGIAKIVGCDPATCRNILVELGFNQSEFTERAIKNGFRKVAQIDATTGRIIKVFRSMTEAAKSFGSKRNTNISNAIKRGHKAFGYAWQIIDEAPLCL